MPLLESVMVKEGKFVDVWRETHTGDVGVGTFSEIIVRNKDGDFVAFSEKMAEMLEETGIAPELASPDDDVCSIGFSAQTGKYYGWSHRSIHGFEIGDRIFSPDDTSAPPGPDAPLILTREEQRSSAAAFAEYMG